MKLAKKIKLGIKKRGSRINLFKTEAEVYGLPSEVKTELNSNRLATVEGFKSVIQYYENLIKLGVKGGSITFMGTDLRITVLSDDGAEIRGFIQSVEYDIHKKSK